MLNEKTLKLYSDYVTSYNIDPESEKSDSTYELFADSIFDKYEEGEGNDILDVLCTITPDNKINLEENLNALKSVLR